MVPDLDPIRPVSVDSYSTRSRDRSLSMVALTEQVPEHCSIYNRR